MLVPASIAVDVTRRMAASKYADIHVPVVVGGYANLVIVLFVLQQCCLKALTQHSAGTCADTSQLHRPFSDSLDGMQQDTLSFAP